MKRKSTFFRTLLVAAAMLTGANAWAQDTYTTLYEKTLSGETAWTADDITGWSGTTSNLSINANYGLYYDSKMSDEAYKAFTINESSKIKYEITWFFGGAVGRTSNYEYLQFGDKLRIGHMSYSSSNPGGVYLSTNAGGNYENTTIFAEDYNKRYTKDLSIVFDTSTGEVESFVFDGVDVTDRISGALEGTFNTLHMGFTRGGSVSWTNPHGLVALKVSECKQTVTNADYKVNYVDGKGNALKEAVVRNGVVGNKVSLLSTDKDAIWVNGTKYVYVSDNASTTEITNDGKASVNIVFNVAPNYSYSFKTSFGTTLASGTTASGEIVSTAIPRYVLNDGTFYVYASAANNITYSKSMTVTSDNQEETVNYNDTGYDNVVYFAEAEDITGMTPSNDGQGGARSSMCYGAYAENNVTMTNLPAGKYTLTAYICGNAGTTFRFYAGNTDKEIYNIATTGSLTTTTSAEFTLTKATDIIIGAAGNNGASAKLIDFVYIQRTGDLTTIPATISSATWATLYTDYALDFSGVEGLKAYTATYNGTTVSLTQVSNVPAGTGVVLQGAAGSYNIPVIASSETAQGDLKGSTTEGKAYDANGTTDVYILVQNGKQVQFTKMTSGTLAAGKAYLELAKSNPARLNVVFEGETTGISTVAAAEQTADAVYSLSGQRVATPKKGLYIVNGKKMIIK